ncbi:hypothetical protein Bhyg_07134 [Pseudolycoriella hygida]|uniref:Uncharacterized protein n=1 Tax=Pseudolycoriella hygida TaxID=35572 RepID=A0A9Q0N247_9DIPT|nr:hypothetical protein Bhyg_07134 [Pseudolycoriella hygida]
MRLWVELPIEDCFCIPVCRIVNADVLNSKKYPDARD